MRKVGASRRRWVLAGIAVVLGTLMLGVPGIEATNNPGGKITVVKKTDPAGDPTEFEFILARPNGQQKHFVLHDGEQRLTGALDPGTYSVTELVPDGWSQVSASCDDGSSPSSIEIEGDKVGDIHLRQYDEQATASKDRDDHRPEADDPGRFRDGVRLLLRRLRPSRSPTAGRGRSAICPPARTPSRSPSTEGWTLTSATCSDGSSPSSIDLSAGEFGHIHRSSTRRTTRRLRGRGSRSSSRSRPSRRVRTPSSSSSSRTWKDSRSRTASNRCSTSWPPARIRWRRASTEGWTLTSATCSDQSSPASIRLEPGGPVRVRRIRQHEREPADGSAVVDRRLEVREPDELKEPGGPVTFSVTITNTSADVT